MAKFAERTMVSTDDSLLEIKATLARYGAVGFALVERPGLVHVGFDMKGHAIRFDVKLLPLSDFERTPERRLQRSQKEQIAAHDKAVRQRYRALFLVIKAKLESIESGIETFEEAFMAHLVLPSGRTIAEDILPQLPELRGVATLMLGSGK